MTDIRNRPNSTDAGRSGPADISTSGPGPAKGLRRDDGGSVKAAKGLGLASHGTDCKPLFRSF